MRVSPDLLLRLFAEGERRGWSLGLYGGTDESLRTFLGSLNQRYPRLRVPFAYAPPFRPLTPAEDEEVVARIRSSWGAPAAGRARLSQAGALDGRARGTTELRHDGGRRGVRPARRPTKEAPRWTRDIGLEWAYRLAQEPRRLWRRHLKNDPRFVALLALEILRQHGAAGSDEV